MPRHLQSLEHCVTTEESSGALTHLPPVSPPSPSSGHSHRQAISTSPVCPPPHLHELPHLSTLPATLLPPPSFSFPASPPKHTRFKPSLCKPTQLKACTEPASSGSDATYTWAEGYHLRSTCCVPSTNFYPQILTPTDPVSSLLASSCRCKMMLLERIIPSNYILGALCLLFPKFDSAGPFSSHLHKNKYTAWKKTHKVQVNSRRLQTHKASI